MAKIFVINGLSGELAKGGAENSVRLAVDGLRSNGFNVDFFGAAKEERPGARDGLLRKAAKHAAERWRGLRGEVADAISTSKPDVIWTNSLAGVGTWVWQYAQSERIPVVHTLRDYYLLCGRVARFSRGEVCRSECSKCRVLTWPSRRDAGGIGHVVGNSQRTLDLHLAEDWFRGTPRSVIYPAPGEITCGAPCSESLKVGFIGKHCEEKGLPWLLAQASAGRIPGDLVLAGKAVDDYHSAYRQASATLLGYVSPEALYAMVDIVIVPSAWEDPYPRVVHEAVACGRVVVASDVGGIPEAAGRMPGVMLYKSGDPSSFDSAMALAVARVRECRQTRQKVGAEWAANESQLCVKRYVEVFSDVLGK